MVEVYIEIRNRQEDIRRIVWDRLYYKTPTNWRRAIVNTDEFNEAWDMLDPDKPLLTMEAVQDAWLALDMALRNAEKHMPLGGKYEP